MSTPKLTFIQAPKKRVSRNPCTMILVSLEALKGLFRTSSRVEFQNSVVHPGSPRTCNRNLAFTSFLKAGRRLMDRRTGWKKTPPVSMHPSSS